MDEESYNLAFEHIEEEIMKYPFETYSVEQIVSIIKQMKYQENKTNVVTKKNNIDVVNDEKLKCFDELRYFLISKHPNAWTQFLKESINDSLNIKKIKDKKENTMNEVDTKKLYIRGIAILRKEFAHNLSDLQRMGALDEEAVGQINAVFGIYIKKNGFLPEENNESVD